MFANVRGYPFWPVKISDIKQGKNKNPVKCEVIVYSTNEIALINKTDICHCNNNKFKYSLDHVANKYNESYKKAHSKNCC